MNYEEIEECTMPSDQEKISFSEVVMRLDKAKSGISPFDYGNWRYRLLRIYQRPQGGLFRQTR